MKRTIAILLVIAAIMALSIPAAATSPSGTCGAAASWVLNGDTLTISGTGDTDNHSPWEDCRNQIRRVVIEEGITSIGYCAFLNHANLEEITLPDSLTTIGGQAFQGCDKLATITLPKNVSRFYTKHVACSAASVFSCEKLTAIKVHPENQWFCDVDGVLFDKEMKTLLCYPQGKLGTVYTVPDGVEELAYGSFWFADLDLHLPDTLQIIGHSAFYGAKFSTIALPAGLTEIGESAFANCDSLTQIALPDSVNLISKDAFASCEKLISISINNPTCEIQCSNRTITPHVTVKGHMNSTAEAYAKRYGRDFVDLKTGHQYNYDTGNAGYLALLPTNITGTVPTFCNISTSSITGEIVGYQPDLVLETDANRSEYQEMLAFVNDLTKDCATDYDKAYIISQWVRENMTYRYGQFGSGHTANGIYKMFQHLSGNCEGHTQLTNFMLHLAGIPNGTATSYGHCWSLALLDGRWVMIDSTNNLFDDPYDHYYGDLCQIVFSPDGKIVCVIDDLTGVKLASYGLSVSDNTTFHEITIPDYVTHIYDYTFTLRSYGVGDPYVTIRGTANGYAHSYVSSKLPKYQITITGDQFVADVHIHDLQYKAAVPATCTTTGMKAHFTCSGCSKTFSDPDGSWELAQSDLIIPSTAHTYSPWETTTPATENSTGMRQRTCSACGNRETKEIPLIPHTHNMVATAALAPTHTHPGNTAYYTCSKCHKVYADANGNTLISLTDTFIPALGHSYEQIQSDTQHHWKACSCGHTIDKAAHAFGDWKEIVPATETSAGKRQRSCNACNFTETQQLAPLAHVHDLQATAAASATHTQAGNIMYYTCSSCGNLYADQACTTQISIADTITPALGHNNLSCEQDDTSHWQRCSCGETTTPEAHIYTAWTEDDAASTRSCVVCNHTQSQPVPQPPVNETTPPTTPSDPVEDSIATETTPIEDTIATETTPVEDTATTETVPIEDQDPAEDAPILTPEAPTTSTTSAAEDVQKTSGSNLIPIIASILLASAASVAAIVLFINKTRK